MKKTRRSGFRVEVEPRSPGDFGYVRTNAFNDSMREKDWESACEDIAEQIRRHVNGLPSYGKRGVSVAWDVEAFCEHCGSVWTEDDPNYNGGCCAKDEEVGETQHRLQNSGASA